MKLTINKLDISFKDQGQEQSQAHPTLVFLHYWGGSSRTWNAVIDALPARFRTVAPDLRGWGDSEAAQDLSAYALSDFSSDILGLIKALALESYILVGHSMGGKIAQLIASQRPEGLAGLVLVAPSPPTPLEMPDEARSVMRSAYANAESVGMALDHMLTGKPLSPEHRQQAIEDSLRGAPEAVAAWPNSTSYEDISAEVGKINVPTLVIAGELDKVDPVAVLQTQVLPRIPQSSLHILPATGHLSPFESPTEIADVITAFADGLSSNA